MPILDRNGPLPCLWDLTKFGLRPGYPLHDIAEVTTLPFCISEHSRGWVGVVSVTVPSLNRDIQIPQSFIRAEKASEDDYSLNS